MSQSSFIQTRLLLFWKCRQVAVQVANTIECVGLLRMDEVSKFLKLRVETVDTEPVLIITALTEFDGLEDHQEFFFDDDAGCISLMRGETDSEFYFVVGTGDIRHITGNPTSALHKFKLGYNNRDGQSVIISSDDDYHLKVYYPVGAYSEPEELSLSIIPEN